MALAPLRRGIALILALAACSAPRPAVVAIPADVPASGNPPRLARVLDDRTAEQRVRLLGRMVEEVLPRSEIGTALSTGVASWYPARGPVAAVHSWRFGDRPYWAEVCLVAAPKCVTVAVSDYMANPGRAIDLSDDAFRQLAPLSVGLLRVTVEAPVDGPKLPRTDTRR